MLHIQHAFVPTRQVPYKTPETRTCRLRQIVCVSIPYLFSASSTQQFHVPNLDVGGFCLNSDKQNALSWRLNWIEELCCLN